MRPINRERYLEHRREYQRLWKHGIRKERFREEGICNWCAKDFERKKLTTMFCSRRCSTAAWLAKPHGKRVRRIYARAYRALALILLFFCAPASYGQSWSTFLDTSRAIDWTGVGFSVPSYTVACATQPTLLTGSTNAAANETAIENALKSCNSTHNVVNLPTGTYYVSGIIFPPHGHQVLRGAGANSTYIYITQVPTAGCIWSLGICMTGDPNVMTYTFSPNVAPGTGTYQCAWTGTNGVAGTYTKGATSITLNSCGSAPPNNSILYLDQKNDSADTNGVYLCDSDTVSTPSCIGEAANTNQDGRQDSGTTRSQQQAVFVTNVTGTGPYTLTISPGVAFSNIRTGQAPGAYWTNGFATNDGLENMTIDESVGGAPVGVFNCYQCWVKGVRTLFGARQHILVIGALNSVIENNYMYGSQSPGTPTSYGLEVEYGTSSLRVENNIFQQLTAPLMWGQGSASVIGYNLTLNNAGNPTPFATYVAHNAGNNMNLWEGNVMFVFNVDSSSWGSNSQGTFFRNAIPGWQKGATGGTYPISLEATSRGYNAIGNVLGQPSYHTNYESYATSATGGVNGGATVNVSIYALGWTGESGLGGCGFGNNGTGPPCGPLDRTTLMRWGNYDVVNAAPQWNSTEASPAAVPFINANFTSTYFNTLAHTLPNSLYYNSTPPWWPVGKNWPPIGFDVSTGNIGTCSGGTYPGVMATASSQCTGGTLATAWASHITSIPAQDCYLNIMGGPVDGSGSALAFNAATCYGTPLGPGTPTPIVCPNNSQVGNNANCVQPPLLTFGKQGISTASMAIPASISNCATVNLPECNGTGNLGLGATVFTLSGTNAADFSVGAGGCTANLVIVPGGSCSFTVTFTPSQVAGTNEVATLTIAYAGGIASSVLALTGTSATVTTLATSSCPTALTPGVNYQLTANISCATSAFTVAAGSGSFTDLNLNGFTITWCTGTSTAQEGGVKAGGNNWYTTVHNGSILQGVGSCTGVISGGWGSGAIIGTGSNGMAGTNAFNLTLAWKASQGRGVADNYAGTIIPTVQGTVIHDVTYTDSDPGNCNAVGCRSQDQFYSFTVIQAAQRTAVPVDQFYNVTGTGGPQGTFSTDSSGAICSSNLINLGTSVANGTVANGYVCQDWGNAMIVANNLLLGTGSAGGIISGRGIQLANVSGQAIQQAMIQNNIGVVNILDNDAEYPCATVEYGATYGIQIKVFNSGTVNNNTIQNNNLITTAGPCGGYGFSTTNDVSAPATGSTGNVLRNNQWVCKGNAGFTWTNTVNCAGMRVDYAVGNSTPMFTSQNDFFQGDSSCFYVYFDGSDPVPFNQSTCNKPATAVAGWVFIDFTHGNCCASTSFKPGPFTFTDPVFTGGATESNTNLSAWATSNPSQSFAYIIQFTQKVFCLGAANGKYIVGCTVQYTGPHSTHTCTTDATGSCSVAVIENKYAATLGVYSVTSYNNYTLAVSNTGCTTNTQSGLTISSTNTTTVTMAGCAGGVLQGTLPTLFGFNQTLFGGIHENSGLTYGWQRSWDTPCVWGLIEATAGTYNFSTQCTAFIQSAVTHNAGVIFTMGRTPSSRITGTCSGNYSGGGTCAQFASDIDGVNAITPAFVTALANYMSSTWPNVKWRIEGRNESDLSGECAENSAIGGHCSMVHLVKEQETIYNTIKAINPAIQVLCPPASTFNHFGVHLYGGADTAIPPFPGNGFAAAEGLTYCDVMTVHPYFFGAGATCNPLTTGSSSACTPDEAVNGSSNGCSGGGLGQIACVLAANSKSGFPVESSETDWGSTPPNLSIANGGLTDTQKRQWLGRYIVYAWNAGQTNITWYTWECPSGNLGTCFGTLSGSGVSAAAAGALGIMQNWLIGSTNRTSPCTIVGGTTYECALNVNTGTGLIGPAHIVFDNAGNTPTIAAFGANTAYRLDGSQIPIVGNQYTVDGEPTLLFAASSPPPTPNSPTVLFSGTVPLSGVFQGGVF